MPSTPDPPPQSPEVLRALRRARKQARRDAQRAANIGRAAAMHAARLAFERESETDPADPAKHASNIHIGCSGWFYWDWKKCFYPQGLPKSQWFPYYASQFRTVELNAPFYSWPTVAAVKTWLRQAGRRQFIYTVKVSELITHIRRFTGTKTLVRDFGFIADILGPRMGCFLFQLPPSYRYTPTRLKSIVTQLDPRRRNVVEFRHASWWNPNVYAAFRDAGVIFCSCSGPRLPDELIKTTDDIYVRLHGVQRWYRHDYSKDELAVWTQRIRDSGAKRTWAYFNNDYDCYAIKNARELTRQLRRQSSAATDRH